MGDGDNREDYTYMETVDISELFVPYAYFCWESEISLKINSIKKTQKKKKKRLQTNNLILHVKEQGKKQKKN